MADRNLMPIGRFARSCRLGVKALRHYDELGLLKPAVVDPASGYRYYDRSQARDAVMIGMLRSLDLPLAVVKRALGAGRDELETIIADETGRIEAELAARERALLSLRHIAKRGRLADAGVRVDDLPELRVARRLGTTDPDHLVADSTELIYALLDAVRRSGAKAGQAIFTINQYDDDGTAITVEACAELAGDPRDAAGFEVATLACSPAAWLHHEGPYETLGLAHHALFAWVQERGHEAKGPIWEFYRNDPADVPAEALSTDVALPLRLETD